MIFQVLLILVLAHIALTWALAIWRGLRARRRVTKAWPGDAALPPVSILIPAWNEHGTIEHCIRSLQQIDYPNWEALILAGGLDGTFQAALEAAVGDERFRVLPRGPEPKNVALMQGVLAAHYGILVLLDADSIVESTWLSELVKPVARGAAASFGMHYPSKEAWISISEQMGFIQAYEILDSKLGAGCSSLAIRRDVLERIGPLPAAAYSWEDWDIDVRLIDAGETIVFVSEARLLSDRPSTFREYWVATLRSYRSHLAGVWYHRRIFLQRRLWGLLELSFPAYSAAVSLAIIACGLLVMILPSLLPLVSKSVALFFLWSVGRRAALGAEVTVCTGEHKWLAWAWVPAVLLPTQVLASFVAVLTVWCQPAFDYKGARFGRPS